jgi:NAD(P)-dependent dehydrogenase (short-subunit alcohol dehydrogenase family)
MAMPDLAGKTVVITGASRGLGAGMAAEMARLGLGLGLCARSAPRLGDGERVVARQLDVGDRTAVQAFADEVVARLGPIHLWINNAGVLEPVRFVRELDAGALLDHLTVNLVGVMHGCQAFVRHLRASGQGGVLVNITSGAAQKGYAGWGAYCAGKAAVDRLTECLELEEEAIGLRAHAVAPGIVDTDMQSAIRAKTAVEFPSVDKFLELKRRGAFNSPAFVAREILALAFEPARRPDAVVLRLPDEHAS